MFKSVISFLFTVALMFSGHAHAESLTTKAKQAIIVDYNTGRILFQKNADERMPTSSMSKVMSMYVVFDAIKRGDLALDDEFVVSEKAWRKGGSKMFIEVGKKVRVEDLIRGVIIQSGNDATIALAEGLAGSEDAFAAILTRKAKDLGMKNSNFMNASGWPDAEHYSTARDLSILAKAVIDDFPKMYGYYSEKSFTFNKIKQSNRNPLLFAGIGADGMKTGHTEAGGYGLIGTGVKDGRRVIMVLNGMDSQKMRKQESIRLLQWGLSGFKTVSLFKDAQILDSAPVYLGTRRSVDLQAGEGVDLLVSKLSAGDIKVDVEYNAPIKAPIEKGQNLGIVKVSVPDGETINVPLVAAHSVDEMSFFMRLVTKARLLTTGKGAF